VPDDWVWLARIRRPQGRKGEVFAELLTDFPEKFEERRRVWLLRERVAGAGEHAASSRGDSGPREVELVSHWEHKGGVVLHFAGVDSISAAEALTGLIVAIPREQRALLGEDEAYLSDLVGCTLVDVAVAEKPGGAPVAVGEIEDIDLVSGPAPLLIVRGTRSEILIPFAKNYLRRIDLEHKRVEMALPEGLVDLNEPGK
jgi:16S rRNA processing protein RimM